MNCTVILENVYFEVPEHYNKPKKNKIVLTQLIVVIALLNKDF